MKIWRMRIACWISKATNTHSEYVLIFFSTLTVILRTGLSVTLYVRCLLVVCGCETWLQNQRNRFENVLRMTSGAKTDKQQALPMKTKDF